MRIIKKARIHNAVLWRNQGDTGYGYKVFSAPEQIKCRWDEVSEQAQDANGVMFASIGTVLVDRHVDVGDMLKVGLIEDISGDLTDPQNIKGAYTARKVEKTPALRNKALTNYDQTAVFVTLGL